jgi:hypothetical protein
MNKMKKGLPVRVKRGKGCNLVVNPTNYNIMTRAFRKNKGTDIILSDEEIALNMAPSPEEQMAIMEQTNQELASDEPVGAGLNWKKIGKKVKKAGIKYALKKGPGIAKKLGSQFVKAYQNRDDDSAEFEMDGEGFGCGILKKLKKAGKKVGKTLKMSATSKKGLIRQLASRTLDEIPEGLGKAAEMGVTAYTGNPAAGKAAGNVTKMGADYGRKALKDKTGYGLYAGRGFTGYDDLRRAHDGIVEGDMRTAQYIDSGIRSKLSRPRPLERFSSELMHRNLIQGKGVNMSNTHQALEPQPYSANYQFKFFLPPQYQGIQDMSGSGMYA